MIAQIEDGSLDLQKERILIEQKRLELEEEKLKIEREKNKWMSLSIFIPLLVVSITLIGGMLNQQMQSKNEFELKAAEIVMDTESVSAARNRARTLAALFPNKLSSDFAEAFEPEHHSGEIPLETRIELFRQIIEHNDREAEIIRHWNNIVVNSEDYFFWSPEP
jgi:hypothetical protein